MSVSGELSPGRAGRVRTPLSDLGVVALGGTLGTLARYGIGLWIADAAVTTIVVNLVGAFVLGALMGMMGRLGARAERLRLLLGTGVLGGFTTYSGLAVESGQLALAGQELWAIGYAGITLIAGLAASVVGLWVGGLGSGQPGSDGIEQATETGAP